MGQTKVAIYSKENIEQLGWPDSAFSSFTKKFLMPLIKGGTEKYIANVHATMFALKVDALVLPLSVTSQTRSDNSFVCSPYNHYITYSLEGVKQKLPSRIKRYITSFFINLSGVYLRLLKFDKVVIVNNWLFSTNLYPELSKGQIEAITNFLIVKFPEHAIVFRSINKVTTSELKSNLKHMGYQMIVGRQVFLLDTGDDKNFRIKNVKSDRNILNKSSYRQITDKDIKSRDSTHLEKLYRKLYIDKYSYCNPQYTALFFKMMLENHEENKQFYEHRALEKDGVIDGFSSFFCIPPVMYGPMIGYESNDTKKNKLYRMLAAMYYEQAKKHRKIYHYLHLSAGVGRFKQLRGCVAELEYFAVHYDHLPRLRRLPWKRIAWVLKRVEKRFLQNK